MGGCINSGKSNLIRDIGEIRTQFGSSYRPCQLQRSVSCNGAIQLSYIGDP